MSPIRVDIRFYLDGLQCGTTSLEHVPESRPQFRVGRQVVCLDEFGVCLVAVRNLEIVLAEGFLGEVEGLPLTLDLRFAEIAGRTTRGPQTVCVLHVCIIGHKGTPVKGGLPPYQGQDPVRVECESEQTRDSADDRDVSFVLTHCLANGSVDHVLYLVVLVL